MSDEIPRRKLDERLTIVEDRMSTIAHDVIIVKSNMSNAKWIGGIVITILLGSIIVIATKIFTWGYDAGEVQTKIRHLESQSDSCIQRIDNMSRSSK